MISFLADAWSMEGAQSNNTRANNHKSFRTPNQWCARVILVKSESQAHRVRDFQNYFKPSQSRIVTWSSQGRITRTVESFRAIGLHARVNVVSNQISNFSCLFSMKWHPKCDKLANEKLKTRAQGSFSKFDPRLFMS